MIDAKTYLIDDLCDELRNRFGIDLLIDSVHMRDGSAKHILTVAGWVKATWKSKLVTPPIPDGVTPRGPSEYYNLKFY